MRGHVRTQDGVNASLVAPLLAEPAQQIGVKAHGHDFLSRWPHYLGVLPKLFVRSAGLGIGLNTFANLGIAHPPQMIPVGTLSLSDLRGSASRNAFRAVPHATPR